MVADKRRMLETTDIQIPIGPDAISQIIIANLFEHRPPVKNCLVTDILLKQQPVQIECPGVAAGIASEDDIAVNQITRRLAGNEFLHTPQRIRLVQTVI